MNALTIPSTNVRVPLAKGRFLLGSIPDIQRDRVQFLVDLQHEYGDVVRIHIGPFSATVIFHPDDIQHVLQENYANYSKQTRTYSTLSNLVGNGLIISDGDFWLRQRRLVQPAFHRQQLNSISWIMTEETKLTLDEWERNRLNKTYFDIADEMMHLSLAIFTRSMFGTRLNDPDGSIAANIKLMFEEPAYRFEHPFHPPLSIPTPHNQRYIAARKSLDKVLYRIIDQRRRSADLPDDMLSMLIQASDDAAPVGSGVPLQMSDVQLRDEVVTTMTAGHETTALCLSWTLYLLSQHPEIDARLRQEVAQVLGGKTPTFEDLPNMPYTRMVIDESMRLYPPAWVIERKAIGDDVLGGYHIPAGTTLGISQYATHRHLKFWENPEVFDPQRFRPDLVKERPRFAYFPFGGGPRICLGANFALLEAQLALPMMVQRFSYDLDPDRPVHTDPEVALRPKGGLWMRLKPA